MSNDVERKDNREKLVAWFIANPTESIDTALSAATKEKRAMGLTMAIATMLKRQATATLKQREAEEAARKRAALSEAPPVPRIVKKCDRCGSTEHFISECPVIPEAPPEPLPKFELKTSDDPKDESLWVRAGQFLFEQMAGGLALTTPQVYEVVGEIGTKRFWTDALQRLNGRVFEMTPQFDGPGSANLWACRRDREEVLLEIAASEELTAGALWNGDETNRVNTLLAAAEAAPPAKPTPPPAPAQDALQPVVACWLKEPRLVGRAIRFTELRPHLEWNNVDWPRGQGPDAGLKAFLSQYDECEVLGHRLVLEPDPERPSDPQRMTVRLHPLKETPVADVKTNGVNTPQPQPQAPAPAAPGAGLLPMLQNIHKLSQTNNQGIALLKGEMDAVRADINELKGLKEQLQQLIALLGGNVS